MQLQEQNQRGESLVFTYFSAPTQKRCSDVKNLWWRHPRLKVDLKFQNIDVIDDAIIILTVF